MIRGLYTAESGMKAQWHNINVVANNLANINTTAYKKEIAIFKSFPELLLRRLEDNGVIKMPKGSYDIAPILGKLGTGTELNKIHTKFEQGSLKITNNDFDFSLYGKGFFVIKTPYGETYTRNGNFTINKNGFLVTQQGYYVQGQKGNIQIKINNFKVNEFGDVIENANYKAKNLGEFITKEQNDFQNSQIIDRLKIVRFYDERMLKKKTNSFYIASKHSGKAEEMHIGKGRAKILQGYLETSNVNPVLEMTKMIEIQRSYEANQKVIKSHDQLLKQAVNQIPKA